MISSTSSRVTLPIATGAGAGDAKPSSARSATESGHITAAKKGVSCLAKEPKLHLQSAMLSRSITHPRPQGYRQAVTDPKHKNKKESTGGIYVRSQDRVFDR